MKKDEFEKLDLSEQIKYVEERRANGEGMKNITCSLGYSYGSQLVYYFKDKGYRYDSYSKKYVKVDNIQKLDCKVSQDLIELAKYKSDILEMLQCYKSDMVEMQQYYKNNIDVIQKLDIDNLPKELQDHVIPKSIKVHEKVYNLFDELCDKHSNIKKQDLFSLALYEFYKKYEK